MDLNDINLAAQAEQGAELTLEHPVTGEKIEGMTITLAGSDAKAFRSKQKEIQAARLAKMLKKKGAGLQNSDEEEAELLASVTLGWSGIVVGGEKIKFSYAAAKKLYLDHNWIKEQVDEFVGNRANFFTMPSKGQKHT